jgi:hypothetical protein
MIKHLSNVPMQRVSQSHMKSKDVKLILITVYVFLNSIVNIWLVSVRYKVPLEWSPYVRVKPTALPLLAKKHKNTQHK